MSTTLSEADFLFPREDLRTLLNQDNAKFDLHEASLLAQNLLLRPLHLSDYHKNYMNLLGQHTRIGDVSEKKFTDQFRTMQAYKNIYYVAVIEDLTSHKIVATGTLEIEHKFIRSAALRGRIEDVVIHGEMVSNSYRYSENNLAAVIMDVVTSLGKILGCYKISLESEDHLIEFYGQFGYKVEKGQNYMAVRYRE